MNAPEVGGHCLLLLYLWLDDLGRLRSALDFGLLIGSGVAARVCLRVLGSLVDVGLTRGWGVASLDGFSSLCLREGASSAHTRFGPTRCDLLGLALSLVC